MESDSRHGDVSPSIHHCFRRVCRAWSGGKMTGPRAGLQPAVAASAAARPAAVADAGIDDPWRYAIR